MLISARVLVLGVSVRAVDRKVRDEYAEVYGGFRGFAVRRVRV